MSVLQRNYRVEYIDVVPSIDITESVVSLDDFSLNSTGKLSVGKLTLDAQHGDFITNSNSGATPLLKQFDRLEITIIDDDGIEQHDTKFEITTDLSQLSRMTQYYLPLELESVERNLMGIAYSGFFRDTPLNFHEIILNIVLYYDRNISLTKQPFLTTEFLGFDQNEAPKFNPNIWDFTNIDNCYDALQFVLETMNLPVSAGGAGNRFAMKFIDDPLVDNVLILRVLIQGSNNSPIPLLEQNETNPIMQIDKIKLPSNGTQAIVRGRPKTGHLYTQLDKFVGLLEFYRAIPSYDDTIVYPLGVTVKVGTQRYEAIAEVPISTPPPNVTFWKTIDVGDYIGLLDYSPVTKNKLNETLNGFGNPEGPFNITDFTAVGIPDSNITIRDKDSGDPTIGTNRELVLFRTNTDDVSADTFKKKYLAGVLSDHHIEGTQLLVDSEIGAISGIFAADTFGTGAGNDPNGRPYADSVVMLVQGDWIVTREADDFDQVAVLSERKIYEWNVDFATVDNRNYPGADRRRGTAPGTMAWRDISTQFLGNDCFHSPLSVTQVDGLFADSIENDEPLNDPNGDPYIENSGIRIEYGYNALNLTGPFEKVWKTFYNILVVPLGASAFLAGLAASVFNRFVNPDYTTLGWWWAIPSPNPLSTHNGVTQIGSIYGGDVNDIDDHRYLDLFNMNRTVSGNPGYNQDDSDTQMEITGFEILMNFDITAAGNRIPFTSTIPFTHWAIDKNGVKWKSPKKFIRRLGEPDKLKFEYGEMSPVYYARTPLGINNVLENILVPEIEKNKILFKENVLYEGIQCELSYDDQGRYSPNLFETIIKPTFFNFFGGGTDDIRFIGIIDAVNWIKTPIAISKSDTDPDKRIINPEPKDYPNIVNIIQLQRNADAQEQVEAFPFEQYTVKQGGIADHELEDSLYLRDSNYVLEEDLPGTPNTRLVAVRELHYSVPKNGGLIRKAVVVVKIQ